jgi:hypothetical protein
MSPFSRAGLISLVPPFVTAERASLKCLRSIRRNCECRKQWVEETHVCDAVNEMLTLAGEVIWRKTGLVRYVSGILYRPKPDRLAHRRGTWVAELG